ncbi:hypothetical protein KSP39_PZI004147 [Platanthera zijinensis]|uniref:Uncharacterized protein n=1 Tax=Platanthera zijinensis TaxID=2320716 RepID=A0AAP0GC00_9ASPA
MSISTPLPSPTPSLCTSSSSSRSPRTLTTYPLTINLGIFLWAYNPTSDCAFTSIAQLLFCAMEEARYLDKELCGPTVLLYSATPPVVAIAETSINSSSPGSPASTCNPLGGLQPPLPVLQILLPTEKYDDAIKECNEALELNPSYVKALLRRAEAHEKLEHYEESIADLKKSMELDPSNDQARKGIRRMEPLAAEKREKLKAEMIAWGPAKGSRVTIASRRSFSFGGLRRRDFSARCRCQSPPPAAKPSPGTPFR